MFKERKGLYSEKRNELHSEGRFVILSRHKVVTKKERMNVLDGCHSAELGGGHCGRDKTLMKISERFYWLGLVNDVKD